MVKMSCCFLFCHQCWKLLSARCASGKFEAVQGTYYTPSLPMGPPVISCINLEFRQLSGLVVECQPAARKSWVQTQPPGRAQEFSKLTFISRNLAST